LKTILAGKESETESEHSLDVFKWGPDTAALHSSASAVQLTLLAALAETRPQDEGSFRQLHDYIVREQSGTPRRRLH
jgi:hypothetical protein